jgi:hypothetical protein
MPRSGGTPAGDAGGARRPAAPLARAKRPAAGGGSSSSSSRHRRQASPHNPPSHSVYPADTKRTPPTSAQQQSPPSVGTTAAVAAGTSFSPSWLAAQVAGSGGRHGHSSGSSSPQWSEPSSVWESSAERGHKRDSAFIPTSSSQHARFERSDHRGVHQRVRDSLDETRQLRQQLETLLGPHMLILLGIQAFNVERLTPFCAPFQCPVLPALAPAPAVALSRVAAPRRVPCSPRRGHTSGSSSSAHNLSGSGRKRCAALPPLQTGLASCGMVRADLRVRVETMGSQKCRIVGKSQSVLIMINPIIFTRTRMARWTR